VTRLLSAIAATVVVAVPAFAGPSADWPCVQRKVESLSPGLMWPSPLSDNPPELSEDAQDLAERLALRRVSLEDAEIEVEALAAAHPNYGAPEYGRIFALVFDSVDRHRRQIVAGIERYAENQARLSREIGDLRKEMAKLEAAAEPDFDRIDEIEEEIDWRERIFEDRNTALTYVCETPVILERRLYAIAQMLRAHVRD
jgi:hypothetical protein